MSTETEAAPDMLAAVQEIEPLLESAREAYRFGPSSYTYEALQACMDIRDIMLAAIAGEPDVSADGNSFEC